MDIEKVINHAEATELAQMKLEESNLARCYLDAMQRIAELEQDAALPEPLSFERVSKAASAANCKFGQWMPEKWLHLFIAAYNEGEK